MREPHADFLTGFRLLLSPKAVCYNYKITSISLHSFVDIAQRQEYYM